jgi:TRAP-type C4-dicarboxylate transport system substrate-binding protein
LGGSLSKFGENQKYVVLSNGTLSWSVQIANSQFYQKMSEGEIKNEMRKELLTDCEGSINKDLENENKELKKENKNLLKKLEHLTDKISYIEETIKKERLKTDNLECKKKKK